MENQTERDELLFAQIKKAKRRKRRRVIITVVILLALAGVGIFAAVRILRARVRTQFAANTAEVLSHVAENGRISTTVSGSGTLSYQGHEDVTIPYGVEIEEVLVKAGETVEKDRPLATVDINSVMTTLADTQTKLKELDDKINDAKNDTVSAQMTSAVSGRVKILYAQPGDNVVDVMTEYGAMAVISLDGLMKLTVEADLVPGTAVAVVTGEKNYSGTVEACQAGKSTVTLTDNGPRNGEEAQVLDADGNVLGSGILAIHNPLSITGYAGTVSYVNVKENSQVWAGGSVFTLKNTAYTANYDALLRSRAQTEQTLNDLIALLRSGCVNAPFAGIVTEVYQKTDDSTAASVSMSQTEEADTLVAVVAPDEKVCVSVSVDETDILSLELGQTAQVTVRSVGEEAWPGVVTEISRVGTSSSGVTQYSAVVELEKQSGMLSGMSASVDIQIQGVDDVVLIPVDALHQTRNMSYVFTAYDEVLKEYGGMVEVVTGASNSKYVEIVSGLKPGDTVYYTEKSSFNIFSMMPGAMGGMNFGSNPGGNSGASSGGNRGNRNNGANNGGSNGGFPGGGSFPGGGNTGGRPGMGG